MPRSTKSRTVSSKRKTATAPNTDTAPTQSPEQSMENETMSTTEAPTFDFVVEPAPEDYQPERSNPGRKRAPSPFDGVLVDVKDRGWQRVPYSTEEQKDLIVKELHRAKQYHNLGMDLNETDTHIEFQTRDLQKRKPRRKKDENGNFIEPASSDGESDSADDATDVDNDE